jgi:hypothetical protein
MIQTIHIGRLLRETVTSPYRNLVTRPTGAAVRGRIQAALASDCRLALLDFSGIELLDLSCADEVVAKLILADAGCGRCVVLSGLREDQHEAIEHVLTHHRLAVAVLAAGDEDPAPRLLGWVSADGREAFACLCGSAGLSAEALAATLDWTRARVEEALAALALHRLVWPEGDLYRVLPLA